MPVHKGTELNNIQETWNQNERMRENNEMPGTGDTGGDAAGVGDDLQRVIKEEAAEYDNANKEDRVLDGDRATVNNNNSGNASDESDE